MKWAEPQPIDLDRSAAEIPSGVIPHAGTSKKVLVVAQELEDLGSLVISLRESGFRVEIAGSASEAVQRAAALGPDLVVIQDPLEGVNAVELSTQIRAAAPSETGPLFIMALSSELATSPVHGDVIGLRLSALAGRIRQILTVPDVMPATPQGQSVQCQGIRLDRVRHRAWVDGQHLHFTPTEFKLLWELASRPGYALSRTELTHVCKGSSHVLQARTIDAHIKSIRRKLGERSSVIETVHGIGYRFREPED